MAAAATSIVILPEAIGAFRVPTQVIAYGAFLFCICMLCHGELVRLRPGARQLTLFYLLIALGGALGGTFVSIGAPALFPDVWEFHAAILVGWIVIAFAWRTDQTSPFHSGDRWLFASLVTIAFWLALRYLIERTRFGRIDWVASHDWTVTLVAGAVLATAFCAALWKSRIARTGFWPQALVLLVVLLSGMSLLQRIELSRDGTLYAARNFYGVIRVMSMTAPGGEARQLMHGTTVHGVQVDCAHPTPPYANCLLLPLERHRPGVDPPDKNAPAWAACGGVWRRSFRNRRDGGWHDVRVRGIGRSRPLLRDQPGGHRHRAGATALFHVCESVAPAR